MSDLIFQPASKQVHGFKIQDYKKNEKGLKQGQNKRNLAANIAARGEKKLTTIKYLQCSHANIR